MQAVLYDEKGFKLDALHVHPSDVISGEQLESDRSVCATDEIVLFGCTVSFTQESVLN